MQVMIKDQYARTKQILTEKRDLLTLIAKTLLEVETLDAAQIKHLEEHGTLPDRSYDELDKKAAIELNKEEVSDAVGAPADPSISDLPKEEVSLSETKSPVQEERRD